jgi:hypothetical protein
MMSGLALIMSRSCSSSRNRDFGFLVAKEVADFVSGRVGQNLVHATQASASFGADLVFQPATNSDKNIALLFWREIGRSVQELHSP